MNAMTQPTKTGTNCDCLDCERPARWQVHAIIEPSTKWRECDYHSAESRKRGYIVRSLRHLRRAS